MATVKKAQKRTVAVKKPTVDKVAEVKEFNPIKTLSSYQLFGKKILNEEQAKLLLSLKNRKGQPLFDITNACQIFEVLIRIQNFGFDDIYAELSPPNKTYVNLEDYFFSLRHVERATFVRTTLMELIVEEGEEGFYQCTTCLNEGRDPTKTKSFNAATRGDEPAKVIVSCKLCGKNWITK